MIKLIVMGILVGALSVVGCDTNTQQQTQETVKKEEFKLDPELEEKLAEVDRKYEEKIEEIDREYEEKLNHTPSNTVEEAQATIKTKEAGVPLAPESIYRGLLASGFSEGIAIQALQEYSVDWNEVALEYGEYWSKVGFDTPDKLKLSMSLGGFEEESIDYTIRCLFK